MARGALAKRTAGAVTRLPATIGTLHVLFPFPLGFPAQPAGAHAGGKKARRRAPPRSHRIQPHARRHRVPAGDPARAFEDPGMLAYDPAPAGRPPGARGRSRLLRHARRAGGARTHPAHGQHQRSLRLPFQAAGGSRRPGAGPRPSYPLFEFLGAMESIEVRQYPLVYHGGWSIDLDALAGAISPRTRAVALVNPNNPTGSYVKRLEVRRLARLCAERGMAIHLRRGFLGLRLCAGPPARRPPWRASTSAWRSP